MLGVTLLFATNLHYLVIAALDDSYSLFAPGEIPLTGDMAALMIVRTLSPALSRSASSARRRFWSSDFCSISASASCRG